MKCAVSEIFFNFFLYFLICIYTLYVGAWSCESCYHENKNKKEEERFDVLMRNELQLLVLNRFYT
jgi:hypothetical protein